MFHTLWDKKKKQQQQQNKNKKRFSGAGFTDNLFTDDSVHGPLSFRIMNMR